VAYNVIIIDAARYNSDKSRTFAQLGTFNYGTTGVNIQYIFNSLFAVQSYSVTKVGYDLALSYTNPSISATCDSAINGVSSFGYSQLVQFACPSDATVDNFNAECTCPIGKYFNSPTC
jgi:hypothetical protein